MSEIPQFAFGGVLEDVLAKHFSRDAQNAVLSTKFKLYYLLRPLIPISLRQVLQRTRNRSLETKDDWYIPVQFLTEFLKALRTMDLATQVIHPWPDGHRYALSLTHDIETAHGQRLVSDIAQMEETLGLRSAWYFIPYKYKLDHQLIKDLKARGHEVGIHGYNHDGRLFTSKAIFSYRTSYINKAGSLLEAKGFRAPMVHRNLEWMQQLEFAHDASCFDIDPFQSMPGGVGGVWPFIVGKLVELPYTLPQDHTLMVTLRQPAFEAWVKKMNLLKRLAGMAMLITHPDYLSTAESLGQYQRFCEHAASQDDNPWFCLPSEIAMWWRSRQVSSISEDGNIVGPASMSGRVVEIGKLFQDLPDD